MLMASGLPTGACAAGRTASGLAILAALVCLRSLALLLRALGGAVGICTEPLQNCGGAGAEAAQPFTTAAEGGAFVTADGAAAFGAPEAWLNMFWKACIWAKELRASWLRPPTLH